MKVPTGTDGIYHCDSRVVDGNFIFGRQEKEQFIQMMWRIGDFPGIQILDYSIMSNHYHQILLVPGIVELSNEQLLARLKTYYGETGDAYLKFREAMDKRDKSPDLLRPPVRPAHGEPIGVHEDAQARLFHLVQPSQESQRHTLDGNNRCREGIMRILKMDSWDKASQHYRLTLMQKGQIEAPGKSGKIIRQTLLKSLEKNGKFCMSELLRLRVRYFTCGLVFGSEEFVEELFQQNRSKFGEKRRSGARPIKALPGSGLHVIRDPRKSVLS